uniref:Saposin B-type domain-containing protein n=1 Tax=Syphacia muris TaxID=451379 RepID=A0A0N5AHV6_9BILA
MAYKLVSEERRRQAEVLLNLKAMKPSKRYRSQRFLAETTSVCPEPNKTMEFTPAPAIRMRQNDADNLAYENVGSNSEKNKLQVPSMFYSHPDYDPYVMWINKMHKHLESEDEACNTKFAGLNRVTNNQFWSFVSVYLTNYASSLCPLCDGIMSKIEQTVLRLNPITHTEEERYMMRRILARMPQARGICSSLLPSCHKNYRMKALIQNGTADCLKCPLCTAGLKLLQHRFLLSEQTVQDVLEWLQANVFHNICAELCIECLPPTVGEDGPCVFFPNGSDYNKCMDFTKDLYNFVVDAARNILKPEYFCSVELEWCELNESPNIMNCLLEMCHDGLPVHIADSVCKLIPADLKLAQKYLNTKPKSTK